MKIPFIGGPFDKKYIERDNIDEIRQYYRVIDPNPLIHRLDCFSAEADKDGPSFKEVEYVLESMSTYDNGRKKIFYFFVIVGFHHEYTANRLFENYCQEKLK